MRTMFYEMLEKRLAPPPQEVVVAKPTTSTFTDMLHQYYAVGIEAAYSYPVMQDKPDSVWDPIALPTTTKPKNKRKESRREVELREKERAVETTVSFLNGIGFTSEYLETLPNGVRNVFKKYVDEIQAYVLMGIQGIDCQRSDYEVRRLLKDVRRQMDLVGG